MNKHTTTLFLGTALVLMLPNVAMASTVLQDVCGLMLQVFYWMRGAVYVLGAIALALMSFQASVMGKFALGNFVSWMGGLFVMAMTPALIAYLTDGSFSYDCAV